MAKEIFVDPAKCLGCKSCELACAVARGTVAKTLVGAVLGGEKPRARVRVLAAEGGEAFPVQCRQCEEAPCLDACPTGALIREPGTRAVLLGEDRCISCYMCVMVCPFGAVEPVAPAGPVVKCDRCHQREEPACVAACPTGALIHAEAAEALEKMRAGRAKDESILSCLCSVKRCSSS